MEKNRFKVKNTGMELDESEYIMCSPVHYVNYTKDRRVHFLKLRKIISDEGCDVEGIWVEDGWLIPLYDEELEEGGKLGLEALGSFVKSFQISLKNKGINFCISLTEYENYSMVDVSSNTTQEAAYESKLFSKYIRSIHIGNIQNSIIQLKTYDDVMKFVKLLKELA